MGCLGQKKPVQGQNLKVGAQVNNTRFGRNFRKLIYWPNVPYFGRQSRKWDVQVKNTRFRKKPPTMKYLGLKIPIQGKNAENPMFRLVMPPFRTKNRKWGYKTKIPHLGRKSRYGVFRPKIFPSRAKYRKLGVKVKNAQCWAKISKSGYLGLK